MIKMDGDKVKVEGQRIDVMAELAVVIKTLHYDCKIPRELIVDAFIMGMLGEGRKSIGRSLGFSFDIKEALNKQEK